MINKKFFIFLFAASVAFHGGCKKSESDSAFQKTESDPKVSLFHVLDETPALKSTFNDIDPHTMNVKMNEILIANPHLTARLLQQFAETFYGENVTFPLVVRDLSESLNEFRNVYKTKPEALDDTIDVVRTILYLDSEAMSGGAGALVSLLRYLLNNTPVFQPDQEFSDIGVDGANSLIDNISFVEELYDNSADFRNIASLIRNFLETVIETHTDPEQRIESMIEYLNRDGTNPDSVQAVEEEIANWMVADADKSSLLRYLLQDLYPMVKDPTIDTAGGRKNFIIEGKQLLDKQAAIFSETAAARSTRYGSTQPSTDATLYTQRLLHNLYRDLNWYDHLEDVPVIDIPGNDLLKWLNDEIFFTFNKTLALGADAGIKKDTLQKMMWTGNPYTSQNGYVHNFKGILYNVTPGSWTKNVNDGYCTLLAKTKGADGYRKPFRIAVDGELNSLLNHYKDISLTYNNESIIESILTNLQLHLLSYYFSPSEGKWALTPEDGQSYFGDHNRNVQTLLGGLTQSLRNVVMLDRNGNAGGQVSILTDLLYVISAASGYVDPAAAPGELSLQNCLKSMGSPLGTSTSISVDVSVFTITIDVLGNSDIYRKSDCEGSWVNYPSQWQAPANELLQPGTFRRRTGTTGVGEWHGKFAPSQGDVRGIANDAGQIMTGNWTLSEIAMAGWEGFGPYTYKGKAPNGSTCKYKNDYYTDWYYINKTYASANKGPGIGRYDGWTYGRYHIYEKIYKAAPNSTYGYVRDNKSDGSYSTVTMDVAHRVTLDCASREEAIRKNIYWVLNQKKYQYLIPIHAAKRVGFWPLNADIDIFAYASINCNGIVGITKVKRKSGNLSDNAVWGNTNISSNFHSGDDYFLDTTNSGEPSNTARFKGVSFSDGDYCVALDYRYYTSGLFGGLAAALVDLSAEIWRCLGNYPILPPVVGDNMKALVTMCNKTYDVNSLINTASYGATDTTMQKFGRYLSTYYPTLSYATLKDNEFPPIPKVYGVSYPTAFDANGNATTWSNWTGENKGMFDEFLMLLAVIFGTIHEEGRVYADVNDSRLATEGEVDTGNIGYYAHDGFRAQLDNMVQMVAALNESKYDAGNYPWPAYNANALSNILIDHNPNTDATVAGSKLGLLPKIVQSKYANLNYTKPIKEGVEKLIKHVVRTYLDNGGSFYLTKAYRDGGSAPADLPSYFLADGVTVNPDVDWEAGINQLRWFCENTALDQLKSTGDFIKDLFGDARFIGFVKKSVPAINTYLVIKYMDEHLCSRDVALANALQLTFTDQDIDDFAELVKDIDYANLIDFIKNSGINDIEKFYNFSFDKFMAAMDQQDLQENLDLLNSKIIKWFGINLKEGLVEGVYERKSDSKKFYGLGEYIKCASTDPGAFQDNGTWFRYIDHSSEIFSDVPNRIVDETAYTVVLTGLRQYFNFRHDVGSSFIEYCADYTDRWYRNGVEECPNIYNPHGYDLRMDWLMTEYNRTLISFTNQDFNWGAAGGTATTESYGRTGQKSYVRVTGLMNNLYGWNGASAYTGADLNTTLNYYKDKMLDGAYDTTFTVSNPADNFKTDYTASARAIIQDYRSYLIDNLFEYEYATGLNETFALNEPAGTHQHALNNWTKIISEALNPGSPFYKTGELYDAWTRFVITADIEPEKLQSVQEAVAAMLWDSENGQYTHLFTNTSKRLPAMLNAFKGMYDDLLALGLVAFDNDGIGAYLAESMHIDSGYSCWNIVEELHTILQKDIFRDYTYQDTFWYQMGELMKDFAIILMDRKFEDGEMLDYYSAFKGIFE